MRPWLQKEKKGWLVRWRDFHGNKQSSATLPDETQARRFAQMISMQLSQQLSLEASLIKTTTFRDAVELWLSSLPLRSQSSRKTYHTVIAHCVAKLGDYNLAAISPLMLLRYGKGRMSEVAAGTYSLEVGILHRVFAFARDNMLVSVDPSQSLHSLPRQAKKHRCLSWQEESELLARVATYAPQEMARMVPHPGQALDQLGHPRQGPPIRPETLGARPRRPAAIVGAPALVCGPPARQRAAPPTRPLSTAATSG